MENKDVIDLAIKRHDLDANWFQQQYDENNKNKNLPFIYGRKFVLEELDSVLANLPKGSRILDVGSGTGHLTALIKSKGFEVHGIEPAEEMLSRAKNNFPDIDFKYGLSSKIPFEDNQFDLIVAFEVLRYLNEEVVNDSYKEFYRVLKPGGKFFVTHVNKYSSDWYYFFYYIKGFIQKIRKITYHYCYFTTPRKEEQKVKKAGFSEVKTIGRLDGKVRLGYKFGKIGFNMQRACSELFHGKQRFLKFPLKSWAGHLIVIGTK